MIIANVRDYLYFTSGTIAKPHGNAISSQAESSLCFERIKFAFPKNHVACMCFCVYIKIYNVSIQLNSGRVDFMFAIGRKEGDWFPFLYGDGSKCWKMGKATNKYYHLRLACVQAKHPTFRQAQITPLLLDTSQIIVTDLLRGEWFTRFGVWLL